MSVYNDEYDFIITFVRTKEEKAISTYFVLYRRMDI